MIIIINNAESARARLDLEELACDELDALERQAAGETPAHLVTAGGSAAMISAMISAIISAMISAHRWQRGRVGCSRAQRELDELGG